MRTPNDPDVTDSPERVARGSSSVSGYVLVERNIHRICGKYRVLITRRPQNLYGGRHPTLSEARRVRDELEKSVAARKPWGIVVRKVEVRKTTQSKRMERRAAGLCQECGDEPPKAGCVICQSCLTWSAAKRRNARLEAHNDPSSATAPAAVVERKEDVR